MAISVTVYSEQYPNNTKTVTVDMVTRVPSDAEGDEKFVLYVYTTAYSDNTNSTSIAPVYLYNLKRGWAQGFEVSSPVSIVGDKTLTVAIDEADTGAVSLTVVSGSQSMTLLASNLQSQLRATASGTGDKVSATNRLSYMNSQVTYDSNRLTFVSGATKNSYHDTDWTKVTSVKVTGGTAAASLGFTTGYPNSYDIAATTSGSLHGPASAHTSIDDAIRFAIMTLANQIDYSS